MISRSSALAFVLAAMALPTGLLRGQSAAATFGKVIALGATPSDVILDQSRNRLYLVNTAANRIDIFSTTTNAVVGNIAVGQGPLAAAISMDNAWLYVTNGISLNVSVIDLTSGTFGTVTQTVTMPTQPQGVAVGSDGRALISTLGVNSLWIFDRLQVAGIQLTPVVTPPPPSTPTPLPSTTLATPTTKFLSKLSTVPSGQYIVGLTNPTANLTYMFVYEVSSGTILRSRTVTGQSTVLSLSPDGSRFMAGFTLYDVATLSILGQMNNANAPFAFNVPFNTVANIGGSVFSPDGSTLFGAFNIAATSNPPAPSNSSTLLLSDPGNLAIRLGIRMPESIVAKMVVTSDGADAWSLSQSGLLYLPLSTLFTRPIIAPSATQVFLSQNPCNPGLAQGTISINNAGAGKLTFAVTTISPALTSSVSTGVAPGNITFTMEPGRITTVTRQAGTNLIVIAGGASQQGQPFDVTLASNDAINIPPVIRVYMNYRNADQRGVIFPVPTTPNNSPVVASLTTQPALIGGDMGLQDIVLDQNRNRIYISNAGYNRIEVFDTVNQIFLPPIKAGQLPGQMALSTDGNTLFVASTGSELIDQIDLILGKAVGKINFPPLPRQAGGQTAALNYPQALAVGLDGLEFVMSNGGQWKVVGGTAIPRAADTVTLQASGNNLLPVSANTRITMLASPDFRNIITLASNGNNGTAYLYDAASEAYVASALLFGGTGNTIQGFFGPLSASPGQSFFTLGGLFTNNSLTVIGGSANPAVAASGSPALRNVVATAALDANSFVRLTTPLKTLITSVPTTDARPTLELINIATGAPSLLGAAPENPRVTAFATNRFNMPARSMVIDGNNVAYIITISGLSVVPLTPGGATAPQITARNGVLNATGSTNLNIGGFINVTGTNLATTSTASVLPVPTVLGGSCVTFNDVALPLLQTSSGRIVAQIPNNVSAGSNVVQVRSIGTGLQSTPVVVTVLPPAGANNGTAAPPGVVSGVNNNRIGQK